MASKCRYLQQLKTFVQNKIKNKEMLPFLIHHTKYFLFSFLTHFVTMCLQLYNRKNSNIAESTPSYNIKSYSVFSVLFFFSFKFTLSVWGYWEKSSFCHCNLYGLRAHDYIKVILIQAYIPNKNFACQDFSKSFYIK